MAGKKHLTIFGLAEHFHGTEYHERNPHKCALCALQGEDVEPILIGPGDTLRLPQGEATAAELDEYAARKEIETLNAQELARNPGMTYAQADARTRRASPDLHRRSLGLSPSVEDHLRRLGPGRSYAVEDEGGTRTHLDYSRRYATDQTLPTGPGIVGGSYVTVNGVRLVGAVTFSMSEGWTAKGAAEHLEKHGYGKPVKVEVDVAKNLLTFILAGPEHGSSVMPG